MFRPSVGDDVAPIMPSAGCEDPGRVSAQQKVHVCFLLLNLLKWTSCQNPCQRDSTNRYANCQGQDLVEVPQDLPVTLQSLDLSYNRLFHIRYEDFSSYTNLRALNLSFNNISTIECGSFASNTLLRNLTLFNNSLTEMPSTLFEPLLLLEFLDVSNNLYNYSTLGKVFENLVNLQNLAIGGPLVSKVLKDDFAPIKNRSLKKFSLKTMSKLGFYEPGALEVLNTRVLWLDISLDTNAQALPLILKDLAGKTIDSLRFRRLFESSYYTDTMDLFCGLVDINIRELIFFRGMFTENLLHQALHSIQKSTIQDLLLLSVKFDRSLNTNNTHILFDRLYLNSLVIRDIAGPHIFKYDWTFTWFSKVRNLQLSRVHLGSLPCIAWRQMGNIECLDVSDNRLIGSNLYNPSCWDGGLPKLDTFIAANNNLQSLRLISLLTAKWPKLTKLDLSSNDLGVYNEVCTWIPNITTLILKGNTLKMCVFQCLPTSVELLDLSYSQLEQLDLNYFNRATNLKELVLSHNKLNFISSDWRSPNLQVLHLEGNSISLIDKGTFKDLPSLRRLTAGNNPYDCTCDLYAFFSTLQNNDEMLLADWPYDYQCFHPQHLRDTDVEDYTPWRVECDVSLVITISVSTTAAIIILCMLVCWRFDVPWYLRMTWRIVKSKYRSKKSNKSREYNYHAFISYSYSDADWVRGELLYRLESCSPPYRVCIHERDFLPGRWIIDNIIENIENSRKIIFVLSSNFINSEWCNYELYFAHQRAIGHSLEDIILVVKEKVTMEDLPKRFHKLRKMLRTKTYLEWPSEPSKQHFFWIQLKSILGDASVSLAGQEGLSVVNEAVVGPVFYLYHI
ncbi:hypothetical protein XENTR_v10022716 [Xenopus tropicalis]|uniref:Toll-like receptor 2 n=2 Tax=Xenopus tropicalis TaxID=8364 RepID=F6PY71_XENTR|nr:toll-like receptor 2 [Xenopus tropicalis]KAE8588735.1 hypothetical protein XENTR_v10022716 [Xenopus tropicalis]|eukprot:XP_012810129.1 PREDICTED: toll-like receptor 2 [Xenopus tropicalis]